MVIAGAYTESDARAAVHRVAFAIHCRFKALSSVVQISRLRQIQANVKNFKVNNVVGSASLGFRVDLAACYADNQALSVTGPRGVIGVTGHLQLQSHKFFRPPVPLLAAETTSSSRGAS